MTKAHDLVHTNFAFQQVQAGIYTLLLPLHRCSGHLPPLLRSRQHALPAVCINTACSMPVTCLWSRESLGKQQLVLSLVNRSVVMVVSKYMPAGPTAHRRSSQRRLVGRCCLGPLYPPESAGGCAVLRCLQWYSPEHCCPSVHQHHDTHMSATNQIMQQLIMSMSWVCHGYVMEGMSWVCHGCVMSVSWVCHGCVMGVSWVFAVLP